MLVAKIERAAVIAQSTCPQCGKPNALKLVKPAERDRNLDEWRCQYYDQVVLELVER